jgi:hypothetical protein
MYLPAGLDPKAIINYLSSDPGPCTDFQIRVGNSGGNKNSRRIKCRQGRKGNKCRAIHQSTTTTLPTSTDDVCKFGLPMYHDAELDRWYFRQNTTTCWTHNGHPPVPRELQYDSVRYVPEETLKTAQDLLTQLIPTSVVGKYIETVSGKSLSEGSIDHLRKLVLDKKHDVAKDNDDTTAQKLLRLLERTPGMSYVTYTGKLPFFRIVRKNIRDSILLTLF